MIIPSVGRLYINPKTGMVVVCVTRTPWETSLATFPGRVLFAGRSARWDLVGRRLNNLSLRTFVPVQRSAQPQLTLFASGRTA